MAGYKDETLPKADRDTYLKLAKTFRAIYDKTLDKAVLINDTFGVTTAPDDTKGSITFVGTAYYLDGLTLADVPKEFTPGGAGKDSCGTIAGHNGRESC